MSTVGNKHGKVTIFVDGNIPADLVINLNQTDMKIVPSCLWTMERKGTKCVEILAIDKYQITTIFGCSFSGNFLPVQLMKNAIQKCPISNSLAYHMHCKPLVK